MINKDILPVLKTWKCKERKFNICITLLVVILILIAHSCSKEKEVSCLPSHPVPAKPLVSNGQRWHKFVAYFKKSGNKHPEMMATAVLETKRPKLMAALAVKGERNTPYTVRRGGFRKRHRGAFQVNEALHGAAGETPIDQALKSERIIEDLLAESGGNLQKALNRYGGDRTKKQYAKNILQEIENTP